MHPIVVLIAQAENEAAAEKSNDVVAEVYQFAMEKGLQFGLSLLTAIAIFIIGRWLAMFLTSLARRALGRVSKEQMLVNFVSNLIYALLLAFVILAALSRLGVNTTSFAAVLAAAGLAVGLALQGSLSNFAAGIMIVLFKPFRTGDFVEAADTKGVIEEIHIFNTFMRTPDNIQIIVPNSSIINGTISNYSTKPTRRIDLVIGCGYDDDLRQVKQFLEEVLAAEDRILADPEPVVAVNELGDNSVNFVVRPWVNSGDYWNVRWDLTERIKVGFDERGFSIPYPQRDVHMHTVSDS